MILMTIRMKVLTQKHKELSQTISSLTGSIRMEKGCKRCDFYRNADDENDFLLQELWDSEENLHTHMKSNRFRILQGTANLLSEPCEIVFHGDFHPGGLREDQEEVLPVTPPDNIYGQEEKKVQVS